jgi:hypothetical protein
MAQSLGFTPRSAGINNMIYLNRQLNSFLTYLTLAGQDESGRLEWIGNDKDWYNAELNSLSVYELKNALETQESDYYDLKTNHK